MEQQALSNEKLKSEEDSVQVGSWFGVALALFGGLAVALGLFEAEAAVQYPVVYQIGVALVVAVFGGLAGYRFLKGWDTDQYVVSLQGPMIWTVGVWILFRFLHKFAMEAAFIPAIYMAWLFGSFPLPVLLPTSLLALAMEIALTMTGNETWLVFGRHCLLFAVSTGLMGFFVRSRAYRHRVRKAFVKAKEEEESESYARDLGLVGEGASIFDILPSIEDLEGSAPRGKPIVETVTNSLDLQLELLRQSLDLTTVAILWADSEGRELRLRNMATVREDILPGPYPLGSGIFGALRMSGREATMVSIKSGGGGLPYYAKKDGVGSIYALRIEDDPAKSAEEHQDKRLSGVLCIDRVSEAPWKDEERLLLRLAVRKLALDLSMARRLLAMDHDRGAMQRVCLGLRELNSVLGLEQAFVATIKIIRTMAPAELTALSLFDNNHHVVVWADGHMAEHFQGREFAMDDGLVGQAVKLQRTLPLTGEYRGPAPIFTNSEKISEFKSLLVMPLIKEDRVAIGALVVAAKKTGVFNRARRDVLELIAAQVAIKIDLGQAHDKINKMATTDGLTELANHRTFQHGFEMMLKRAERQASAVTLVLCDLDFFKKINDTHGHPFGDQVLKAVAKILAAAARKLDLVARYGGEEFAIVLEGAAEEGARQVAERIRADVEALILSHHQKEVGVTISMGLAVYRQDGDNKDDLISRADQALYAAKHQGRNRLVSWSEMGKVKS